MATSYVVGGVTRTGWGVANVQQMGADPSGANDSTNAFQQAFNDYQAIYVPTGVYKIARPLTGPSAKNFCLFGDGASSTLVQTATGSPLLAWSQSAINYAEGEIRDLGFKATAGNAHTIDCRGMGGLSLRNLYFTDTPNGASNVYISGVSGTQTHDTRLANIRIYYGSGSSGHSGVRLGPLAADTLITDLIMNAGLNTSYCVYFDAGAITTQLVQGHIYNAATNVVNATGGSNSNTQFVGMTLDRANADVVSLAGLQNWTFTGCLIESVQAGFNGITLANCSAVMGDNVLFNGVSGAGYAVQETGTSNFNCFTGGTVGTAANWTSPIMLFLGAHSKGVNVAGYNL